MSDAPDLDALARRYLDLWQDQMGRMADDPATSDMLARTFTLLTRSARSFAAGTATSQGTSPDHGAHPTETPRAPGPAPAAPVPGTGGVDVSQLLLRIEALEKRVAELEGNPVPKPRRHRPA